MQKKDSERQERMRKEREEIEATIRETERNNRIARLCSWIGIGLSLFAILFALFGKAIIAFILLKILS